MKLTISQHLLTVANRMIRNKMIRLIKNFYKKIPNTQVDNLEMFKVYRILLHHIHALVIEIVDKMNR